MFVYIRRNVLLNSMSDFQNNFFFFHSAANSAKLNMYAKNAKKRSRQGIDSRKFAYD